MTRTSVIKVLVIIVISLMEFNATSDLDRSDLLTPNDLAMEVTDKQNGPALSSALSDPHPWKTYNQWMCFESSHVTLESVDVALNGHWRQHPQLTVTMSGQVFEVTPSMDLIFNADDTLQKWSDLLDRSHEICFYAAFLQYSSAKGSKNISSIWVLQQLKTSNGTWSEDAAIGQE